jgi:hypothetical protein
MNKTQEKEGWIDRELAGCQFKDERLGKRFRKLLEQLSDSAGESIPMACQDWANTKAAYRFLANPRVSEAEIVAGHLQASRTRFAATQAIARRGAGISKSSQAQ